MPITIKYVPSPTASGKTYQLIDRAIKLARDGEKVLFVQPTRDLIIETEQKLREQSQGIQICAIFQPKTDPIRSVLGTVLGRVNACLAEPYPDGQVVVITWKTFLSLPFIPGKSHWHLLIDEVPDILHTYRQVFPETHFIITESLRVLPKGAEYGLLSSAEGGKLRAISDNEYKDSVYSLFKDLAGRVVSNNYDNYVRLSSYQSLISGYENVSELTVWSLLKPSILQGFKSVLIAGAGIKDSLLFKIWARRGVNFVLDQAMVEKLRYTQHTNGRLITFFYGTEQPWSKWSRNRDGERVRNEIIAWINNKLEGQPFLWLENEDRIAASPFNLISGQQVLPHKPHGLNGFALFDNVAILSAYNYDPETSKFLSDVAKVNRQEQRDAFAHETIYQSICRCSVRDLTSSKSKMVFVADRQAAEWLQARFEGSAVKSMGILPVKVKAPGRPKKHDSDNDRKAKHRANRTNKLMSDIAQQTAGLSSNDIAGYFSECDETTLALISNNVSLLKGTLLARKFDVVGLPLVYSDAAFIDYLKFKSKIRYSSKDDNALISPAIFDPNKSDRGSRTLNNVVTANGLWFDVEGGNLSYKEWPRIFPHIKMAAFNTHSHTKEAPRYRVVILTSKTMSVEVYKELWHQIKARIVSEGYELDKIDPLRPHLKAHGIDKKFNPSDMFYLPCQAKEPKDSFFRVSAGNGRKPLDVFSWVQHPVSTPLNQALVQQPSETVLSHSDTLTPDQIAKRDAAIKEWEETGRFPGRGHHALFKLKLRCVRAGITGYELKAVLDYAASNSHTPTDRLRDVRNLMSRQ